MNGTYLGNYKFPKGPQTSHGRLKVDFIATPLCFTFWRQVDLRSDHDPSLSALGLWATH